MKDDAWVLDLPWIPVRSILFRCYGLDLGIILSNFGRYKLSIRVGHPFIQFDSDTGRVSLAYLVGGFTRRLCIWTGTIISVGN